MAGMTGGSGPDIAGNDRVNMGFIAAIVAVATIGGLLFGYDSGAVNGTQQGLTEAFDLDSTGLGFTVGSLLIGCAVGAFFAGRLADAIGRRTVMILAAILFVVGALIQGLTDVHALFVAARFAGGEGGQRDIDRLAVLVAAHLPGAVAAPVAQHLHLLG